jgi:hypothetical protein
VPAGPSGDHCGGHPQFSPILPLLFPYSFLLPLCELLEAPPAPAAAAAAAEEEEEDEEEDEPSAPAPRSKSASAASKRSCMNSADSSRSANPVRTASTALWSVDCTRNERRASAGWGIV